MIAAGNFEEDLVGFYHCHANILSAFSPVLEKELILKSDKRISVADVELQTIKPEIMEMLLTYMYTGEVTVNSSNFVGVMKACGYLKVSQLEDELLPYVPDFITPNTVIGWMQVGGLYQKEDIACRCGQIIATHFKQVTDGHEFHTMSLYELKGFLKHARNLKVSTDDLLCGIFSWINFDNENRINTPDATLKHIQLALCSKHVLNDVVGRYGHILDKNSAFSITALKMVTSKNASLIQTAMPAILSLVVIIILPLKVRLSGGNWIPINSLKNLQ